MLQIFTNTVLLSGLRIFTQIYVFVNIIQEMKRGRKIIRFVVCYRNCYTSNILILYAFCNFQNFINTAVGNFYVHKSVQLLPESHCSTETTTTIFVPRFH